MKNKTKGLLAAYGMVLPAFLVVMLTVAYPIVSAVIQSFQDEDTGAFTTANYTYSYPEIAQRNNLLYTLFVVIVTVVIAIVLAYLLALYLRFVKSRISRAIGMLYLLPRFVPTMCAVYAMITIIRDSGLINRIGLLFGLDIKLGLMYHASGIIVMNMWFNIPFATMMIAAGLGAIPDSIIEASRDSGAGRWKLSPADPATVHERCGDGIHVCIYVQRGFLYHSVPDGRQLTEDARYRSVRSV